jgi:hypothetical protein
MREWWDRDCKEKGNELSLTDLLERQRKPHVRRPPDQQHPREQIQQDRKAQEKEEVV